MTRAFEAVNARHFPMRLPADTVARLVEPEMMRAVWDSLSPHIFPDDSALRRFRTPPDRAAQVALLKTLYNDWHQVNLVVYNAADEPIAWHYGRMEDYLTFYMHTFGLLPAYRGQGIYTAFLRAFCAYIGDLGYERLTSHHQPNNAAVLIGKLKAGWVITGMELDESIGPLVKMTYFTHPDREQGYADVFSLRPPPPRGSAG